ncbi:MAG: rhamnulose-1-phosphate aldolase [Oscillospiraceae bacterium]|nr:rhamnulose-1-phosphate aldolase [Oscillospiraceae bacterium]
MSIENAGFVQGFVRMADDGWRQGWHERNGGNLSYRIKPEELEEVRAWLDFSGRWEKIGAGVPGLTGEIFLVTGSGKFFRNVILNPKENICIIEIDSQGENYRICWGLSAGGRPTSELPSHLMSHEVKKRVTGGTCRVIYHAHPANLIALTFVLPLDSVVFTRELWETATECPVVFPAGLGIVPWMVPGGREIAVETGRLMETFDAAVWAHHGLFCAGADFDVTFGLMHTIEKSAEILTKVMSMGGRRQTILPGWFRQLQEPFGVVLPEKYL